MNEKYFVIEEVSDCELEELDITYNWCIGDSCGKGTM